MPQAATTTPSATEGQIYINFDEVPSPTVITNQYPPAVFSTDSPWYVEAHSRAFYGSSSPNYLDRGPYVQPHGYAPLYVDFASPVNNLKFYVVGADNSSVIAQVSIFQNRTFTTTLNMVGRGNAFTPVLIDLGSAGYNNITRIEIVNINDPNGIGFDDFSFTTAPPPSPTPTPTPAPIQPAAPTNVKATPDEAQILISWSPSQGASSYTIKRSQTASSTSTSAPAPESPFFVPISSPFFCNGVSIPCVFNDNGLDSTLTYSYVISATNNVGTSPDSNPPASAKPLPKPGCSASSTPTPTSGSVNNYGWTMNYGFTSNDGLVISEVYLNGKRMAKQMSVPYFWITTYTASNSNLVRTRGELTPAGTGSSMRSRLVNYKINPSDSDKILIQADYAIDQIPGTPGACLNITQKYEFYREGASPPDLVGPCEPSDTVHPCNKFRPMIDYSFHGGNGEFLSSLNTPIRLHFQNTESSGNTVALTRDFDTLLEAARHLSVPFKTVFNPLTNSWHSQVVVRQSPFNPDKNANTVDNFHQTNDKISVILPGLKGFTPTVPPIPIVAPAGCPECVHFHWRWSSFLSGPNFRNGIPIIPPGSDQAVDIQVNPFTNVFENFHPTDYYQLFNAKDPLRNPAKGVHEPYDVVLWYSPTGFANNDKFFWHTAWFTPIRLQGSNPVSVQPSTNSSGLTSFQDGPVSIVFGSVYEPGNATFDSYDLSTLPPLPPGYAALNNTAFLIGTTGVVSGPHVVNFSAPSVTDQTAFNNLRIFYAEPDPFDPEKPVWVAATILPPDAPAPSFSAKTLSARTERLGVFVIGKLVQNVPGLGVANLRVSSTDSTDPVTAGNNLTYTVTLTNDGPQAATEVALKDQLSPDVILVSATSSQGACKELYGVVYCSLNSLAAGSSATVTLVVQPTEGTASFPPEGKMIANTAIARAKEDDANSSNDWVTEETKVLPNANNPPFVNITTPLTAAMFVGPASITINAVATDTDGAVAKVDFFDNDELIGTGTPGGGNSYSITKSNVPYGNHSLVAVATDNAGRQNVSSPVDVIVNGTATINITSPVSRTLANPSSDITLAASASHPSGFLRKVEFFANQQPVGQGTTNGSGQYSFVWTNVATGMYYIVAVATDASGITTTSVPINFTVGTPPTVAISNPVENTVFPPSTNISVSATAQSTRASIVRVDFYASGILIGSASDVGTDRFTLTWRHVPDGFYSLTAVATDNLGLSATSPAVQVAVNTVPTSGQFIWFDDSLPAGATPFADGEDWYWVAANPAPLSGTKSHQSRNFAQLDLPYTSFHQHGLLGATDKLPVNPGDKLFTYVFLDINNMPREIMLQWNDGNNWEHRAYWGSNRIGLGTDGTNSRRYLGPLPSAGQWVRLEVPADLVGLQNTNVSGMAFSLDAGRATWDVAGKTTGSAPPPTPNDFVWMDDAVPAGSILETVNDQWLWLPPHFSGTQGHRSYFTVNQGAGQFRSHSFRNASIAMNVQPGDVLFTYVFLDSHNMPEELVLQWYDGSSWEHRAYWGLNYLNSGTLGTESNRFMGGIPPGERWVRLEVPASYVGLEGKTVSGMSFGFYDTKDHAGINWDYSGKSSRAIIVPLPLSAITAVWQYANGNSGVSYNTSDFGGSPIRRFYAHPNQAAATVPFYRFKRVGGNPEQFYSQCLQCYDGHGWVKDGIACYVYPDASTPGTVPLYLYHDNSSHYFLTTDQNEANSQHFDAIWAYVFAESGLVPAAPSFLRWGLNWQDNSATETGFKVESMDPSIGLWTEIATVGVNARFFKVTNTTRYYRVRAYNSFGNSAYSNVACYNCSYPDGDPPPNTPPDVRITNPGDGDTVGQDFAITANAFDSDGAGTIAKVEFFADNNKLGELATPPYSFVWTSVAPGNHVLTAKATDTAGAATTSIPVSITVGTVGQNPAIFSDDFNDNSLDGNKWTIYYPQSTPPVTEQSQQLQITLAANNAGYNGVYSNSTFDLTGRMAQVEIAQAVSQAGWTENFFELELDGQNYFLIDSSNNSLLLRARVNGVNDQTVLSYDAATHRHWRVRHDQNANTINFDTSSDGTTWATRKTVNPGFAVSSLRFYLMAGAWGTGNGNPGAAKYDNLRLLASTADGGSGSLPDAGFESLTVGAGNFQYAPTGSSWTFSGGAGVSGNNSGFTNGNPAAPEGNQVAFLQAGAESTISRTIAALEPETTYRIIFSAAQRGNCCAAGQDFQLYLDRALLATFRPTGSGYSDHSTTVFTVPEGEHLLKFVGLNSAGGDNTAFIDNVRITAIGPTPVFYDDFNENSLRARDTVGMGQVAVFSRERAPTLKWTVVDSNSPATVSEESQQLGVTLPASTATYNGVASRDVFDMEGKTVQVEVAQPVSQAGWCENFIKVESDASNSYLIAVSAGSMVFRSTVDGVNDQTVIGYDQRAFPYWRIRHDRTANTVSFETSNNGTNWTTRKQVAAGFSLSAVRFYLYAGAWGTGNSRPGAARYDNFQLVNSP
jgi:uncharacterized repeat protein (TIGR01451 family)